MLLQALQQVLQQLLQVHWQLPQQVQQQVGQRQGIETGWEVLIGSVLDRYTFEKESHLQNTMCYSAWHKLTLGHPWM